ncbi:GIY-YIG nuclease family protein [Erythrobacter sp. WG]|uniref:GIY-YIG nuclease family protein n=1 Tax=Erythrobacter sp. WG TaxID=2985510 RepID=UPI00226D7CBB|nr:GIY-YIG nuclease family protein [Erythrobacter sp. WG]MCX9145911.1 GIY-YIG nuclease family protein [Erythrobacter sp. WG]
MAELSDDELLAELGVEIEQPKARTYTSQQERIIAGFEDIVRFYEEHGRAPLHGEDRDIFERLYAVRLDRLRELEECRELLSALDKHGLLTGRQAEDQVSPSEIDDDALLAELGIEPTAEDDIRVLRHVPSAEERRAAEEIANRKKCEDFAKFKPLFEQVQRDLDSGARETRRFVRDAGFLKADITKGQFFILGGQIAYIAEVGETFKAPNGESDARLRVIYANGTESDLLRRSMQRALYKDDAGRRITEVEAGPLFAADPEEGDLESGTIYVLRSKSDHPMVAQNRHLIHKIGVTGGSVETRIAGADKSATYLLAGVEVVATYKLFNINRVQLEGLIHKVFTGAALDLTIPDRFGNPVKPREWFLVPLSVIDEAVERIRDGSITRYRYEPTEARLIEG